MRFHVATTPGKVHDNGLRVLDDDKSARFAFEVDTNVRVT
jgi:glycine betaine/choline ABC-type transport system substrate-binding protein